MYKIDINIFIPPINLLDREGFSNTGLIDKLDEIEKQALEEELIFRLQNDTIPDIMMIEALAYLKSVKSIPLMMNVLNNTSNLVSKIRIAFSIYRLNKNHEFIHIALNALQMFDDYYTLILSFYYAAKFNDKKINDYIRSYINHPDFLVSYNARAVLGIK